MRREAYGFCDNYIIFEINSSSNYTWKNNF